MLSGRRSRLSWRAHGITHCSSHTLRAFFSSLHFHHHHQNTKQNMVIKKEESFSVCNKVRSLIQRISLKSAKIFVFYHHQLFL
ncbi:hypothetical protein CARUB_v10006148mg [Capsella rubella]|uniref:Uncharacterized protein n=1 Tax=Capsella rubella TaxID=81985 RepID=R0GZK9_9BRAS|nr:hypothetical protein CARUB_v10006148mg [Capsella rubella]